jgi:hypothetical protein
MHPNSFSTVFCLNLSLLSSLFGDAQSGDLFSSLFLVELLLMYLENHCDIKEQGQLQWASPDTLISIKNPIKQATYLPYLTEFVCTLTSICLFATPSIRIILAHLF